MLKETIKSTKQHPVLWLLVAMLLLGVNYADAQVFENSGAGTYSVGGVTNNVGLPETAKRGVIRMKGTATENGTITGLGTSTAVPANADPAKVGDRIPGTVIWAGKAEQNVQPLSYTNLGVQSNNVAKIFGTKDNQNAVAASPTGDKIYRISNDFLRYKENIQATPLGRFEITTWDPAQYPNIRHFCDAYVLYDGNYSQEILGSFAAAGTGGVPENEYTYVEKTGAGDAILYTPIRTGTWTNAAGGATQIVFGGSTGYGSLDIVATLCAYYPPTDDDTIIVTPIDPPDCPDCPVDEDTLVKPPVDPPASMVCNITVGPGVVMNIGQGLYFTDRTDPTKIVTSASASPLCVTAGVETTSGSDNFSEKPGKVIYHDDAKTIVPARSNPSTEPWKGYGILQVETNVGVGGEIIVAGPASYAVTVVGNANINTLNELYTNDGTVLEDMPDPYRRITLSNESANVRYTETLNADGTPADAAGCGEVLGWLYRTASTADKLYTYHNKATTLTTTAISTNGQLQNFGMLMTNSKLAGYVAVGDEQHDGNWDSKAELPKSTDIDYVNRIWEVDYTGTGAINTVNLAFLPAEIPSIFNYDQATTDWQKPVRGYEAYLTAANEPDANTLTSLVGSNAGDPNPWTYANATGSGACDYVLASQASPIDLNGSTAPGSTTGAAWDMAKFSQFVFGNQPLIFTSIRNGRWSDPGTWDKATTPTALDNVNIANLIYTGYYDATTATQDGSFLGSRQWATNEYDLASVKDIDGAAILADSVFILPVDKAGPNPTGDQVALIIGSEESAGDATYDGTSNNSTVAHSAMNFDIPLLFGTIVNRSRNTNPGDETKFHDLTRTKLQSIYTQPGLNGLWITGSAGAGITANAGNAIINPKNFHNEGTFVNEATLEVGHDK